MSKQILSLIKPFLLMALVLATTLTLFRFAFVIWQVDRIDPLSDILTILFNGLRVDLSSIAYLLILPALVHPLLMQIKSLQKPWLTLLKIWFIACFLLVLFFELSTPAFINEYDVRPNRLFIEYLIYPQEVISMLVTGHKLALISSFIGLFIGVKLANKYIGIIIPPAEQTLSISKLAGLFAWLILVFALVLSARGTLGHRPLNPALVYFSNDPLLNTFTLNSAYSVAFAYKQLGDEVNAGKMYGKMPQDEIISTVKTATGLPPSAFISNDIPTLANRTPYHKGKPKNFVLVLEESLGARFVGALDGKGITPEFDKLINSGWSFDKLYATGTRSVRGIEAVITGFTPTPARSVVKLDNSQQGFFSIARLLKQQGYTTQFIYGGESHFDNMKSFFLGNGFTDIVDFDDIENPTFVGSWGASDGDLFRQANIELNELQASGKPFFSFIFTSSNHDPFEIPQGIVPINEGEDDRDRAIRYADHTLGEFITKAKTQPYWQDTVFLIVSDHDVRVFGDSLVPVKAFHIPGVILNSGFTNKRDQRFVSQLDLPVTILSLLGIDEPTPMLGYDLTKDHKNQRTMMQYHQNFAYFEDGNVAILQPQKPISYWQYDEVAKQLKPSEPMPELGRKALAHSLFGSLAYKDKLFRIPEKN